MVKRFSKKQGSKQGVILLTVVFILAMAIIFIAACMVMTQATRNRLYWKAEQSQARLTVTSAAEALYQALLVGDFKESDLKTLAAQGATGILITAQGPDGYLPGMSTDSKNCTTLSLKRKDATYSEIYAYLTTTIGDESENVKITFKVKPKTTPTGLFGNPVDYNGTAGKLNFESEGYVIGGGSKSDNFLIIRKGCNVADSSSNIYSDVVFTEGNVSSLKSNFYGDMVFLDNAKWAVGTGGAGADSAKGVYFVGVNSATDALTSETAYDKFKTSSPLVFANRKVNQKINNLNGNNAYVIDVSGTSATWKSSLVTAAGYSLTNPGDAALQSVYAKASKYSSETFTKQIGTFPSTSTAFTKLGIDQATLDAGTEMTLDQFVSKYGNQSATDTKPMVGDDNTSNPGIETACIKITTGGTIGTEANDGTSRYTFLFDGGTDYIIYFTGTVNMSKCTFAVVNPDSSHNQLIVLKKGANLNISINDAQGDAYDGAGFLSVPRGTNSTSTSNYLTYIYGTDIPGGEMTQSAGVSSYYDSTTKPTFYVIGAGNNQVLFGASSYFEGYLGLFNPDTTTTSKVSCSGNGSTGQFLYGRMMFDGWESGGDAGRFYMPYCPGPGDNSSPDDVELYEFGYTVLKVDYYFTE